MKSWIVHYKNKYPGGQVQASENSIDVYDLEGNHVVALRKNGAGQWQDESESYGLSDRHDLAPIPRDARVHKEFSGNVGLDEEADSRISKRASFAQDGRVLSMSELKKKGFEFDEKGRVVVEGKL